MYFSLVFLLSASVLISGHDTSPEQIHLSLGFDESQMVATWVTRKDAKGSVVEFGCAKSGVLSQVATGSADIFVDGGSLKRQMYIHRVTMKRLIPGHEYVYRVGSENGGWSEKFHFRTMKSGSDWSPTFGLVGDMGVNGKTMPHLNKAANSNNFDVVLHVGDFAYDMDSENATVGDKFMNQIQSFAANIPYMTCVGNHEQNYNFSNYKSRFTMPGGDGEGMFYSMNVGPVHIVAFSSEFYYFVNYGDKQIERQYKWLEEDLKEANKPENRAKQPWIVTMCHRPLYCSNSDDPEHCTNPRNMMRLGRPERLDLGIEDLLYRHGVDVHFQAHEHSYERTWPVYKLRTCNGTSHNPYKNPRAPVHIVTGTGGNPEGPDPFLKYPQEWSAFRSTDHGYTIMKVANETHLSIEQVSVEKEGKIIDSLVIEKDNHFPAKFDCHKEQPHEIRNNLFRRNYGIL